MGGKDNPRHLQEVKSIRLVNKGRGAASVGLLGFQLGDLGVTDWF